MVEGPCFSRQGETCSPHLQRLDAPLRVSQARNRRLTTPSSTALVRRRSCLCSCPAVCGLILKEEEDAADGRFSCFPCLFSHVARQKGDSRKKLSLSPSWLSRFPPVLALSPLYPPHPLSVSLYLSFSFSRLRAPLLCAHASTTHDCPLVAGCRLLPAAAAALLAAWEKKKKKNSARVCTCARRHWYSLVSDASRQPNSTQTTGCLF